MSPLKQIKSGIALQDVKCEVSYVLIINQKNNLPACVKPASIARLESHGWIDVEKFESIHGITNNATSNTQIPQQTGNNAKSVNETNIASNQISINNTTISKQSYTNTTNLSNDTKTTSTNKLDNSANMTSSAIMLSPGITTPTISSTKPGIKIISIEMSPDPLKVGDQPGFTLTWQNISNRTFYNTDDGCGISSLGVTITPEDHVLVIHPTHRLMCAVHSFLVHPGQNSTNSAMADPDHTQLNSNGRFLAFYSASYMVVKPGTLNVNMNLYVGNDQGKYELTETVQFNVNAIQ